VLYDIGANVGAFSLIAALDRGASVVAFEPGYATFARLCENIQLNGCADAIVPIPLPLGEETGLTTFFYRSLEPGQSRHALGAGADTPAPSTPYAQPMCVTTLDRAVADFKLPAPHHLKTDVDGAEAAVLEGAAELLVRRRPNVVVEVHSKALERRCGALLVAHGYRPVVLSQRRVLPDFRPIVHNRWLVAEGAAR